MQFKNMIKKYFFFILIKIFYAKFPRSVFFLSSQRPLSVKNVKKKSFLQGIEVLEMVISIHPTKNVFFVLDFDEN